jgi:hypothetical protein
MRARIHRQITCICISVLVSSLACSQKSKQPMQTSLPTLESAKERAVKMPTWQFRADPYGINDLRPEKEVKPLEYRDSQIVGLISKVDKDQLALLAARLPVLHRVREINSIAVTSPTNAELFFRLYRIYCEKAPTNEWKIVRVTYIAP